MPQKYNYFMAQPIFMIYFPYLCLVFTYFY